MTDGRPQPIGSVAARGHSQWEAVIGSPAALIPLREAAEGVSASLSSKQSGETRPDLRRFEFRNKKTVSGDNSKAFPTEKLSAFIYVILQRLVEQVPTIPTTLRTG